MKVNRQTMKTRRRRENRFEANPAPAPFRALEENELEMLKDRLLRQRLNESGVTEVNSRLRRAANEAAALAWTTHVPLLVFPALFEEKAGVALAQARRQANVRERSREILLAA